MSDTGPVASRGDMLLIAGLVLLSVVAYAGQLGFYSDDWAILAYFRASTDQSLAEILRLGVAFIPYRPGQAANLGILYWLFGLSPLGYHVANALVLAAIGPLFYLVLRECGQGRLIALAVPLVWLCLPHYATNRYWYAAFAVPVCTLFYFASLYADLRVVRPGRLGGVAWKALAVVGLLASVLTYEIWLPLFCMSPLLVWYRSRQPGVPATNPAGGLEVRRAAWLALPTLLAVAAVTTYKLLLTTRLKPATLAEHVTWFWNLLHDAVLTTVAGDFGLRLPFTLVDIFRNYPDAIATALALSCGFVAFAGLVRADGRSGGAGLRPGPMLALAGVGVLVFFAGYGIFFASFNAAVSSTGANNRTAMAPAVGIALVAVGLAGWLGSWWRPGRVRVVVFAATLAATCATGLLIINTVASFWIAAGGRQQQVLAALRDQAPRLPAGATLLLDGVCPYVGPAPVFETWWDTTGALRILYADPTLTGDVVTRKVSLRDDGIYTRIYGDLRGPYPYERVVIFNLRSKSLEQLAGPFAARRYFQENNPGGDGGCQPTVEGVGEPLFVRGAPPVGRQPLVMENPAP
ncbi:MAG: hypothetical protein ABL989_12820 [Gammaproteobacteria bacterium]